MSDDIVTVKLDRSTVGIVELGINKDSRVTVKYYDLRDMVPLPRRRVARVLRQLADNLEGVADRLERLEQP